MGPTRREFLSASPAILIAPALVAGAKTTQPKQLTEDTSRVYCEWKKDTFDMHWLHLGLELDGELEESTRTCVLARIPGGWWLRWGRWYRDIKVNDLDQAKKIAEQEMVGWWRQCLIQLEKKAFALGEKV